MEENLKRMIAKYVLNILMAVFLILFILSLLYYLHGSLELVPSEEQQDKVKVVTLLLMMINGFFFFICGVVRFLLRK